MLESRFRSFGPLRYARITLDPATGRSRGTGFACFWNKEDADRAVQQSELLRVETTGQSVAVCCLVPKDFNHLTESFQPKKNPFSLPSILTPDPSSSLAQSLVLHGRTLDVVKAVTRDVAGKLKEDNERMREKADKRNMYLLREGGERLLWSYNAVLTRNFSDHAQLACGCKPHTSRSGKEDKFIQRPQSTSQI